MSDFKPFSVDCAIPSVFKAIIAYAKEHGWNVGNYYPLDTCLADFWDDGRVRFSIASPCFPELSLSAAKERIKAGPPKPRTERRRGIMTNLGFDRRWRGDNRRFNTRRECDRMDRPIPPKPDLRPTCDLRGDSPMQGYDDEQIMRYLTQRKALAAWQQRHPKEQP